MRKLILHKKGLLCVYLCKLKYPNQETGRKREMGFIAAVSQKYNKLQTKQTPTLYYFVEFSFKHMLDLFLDTVFSPCTIKY